MNTTTYLWLRGIAATDAGRTMTVRQLLGLMHLANATRPLKLHQVATALGLQKPAVTRLATELARLGLITRQRPKDDLRQCFLTITDAGRTFLAQEPAAAPAA